MYDFKSLYISMSDRVCVYYTRRCNVQWFLYVQMKYKKIFMHFQCKAHSMESKSGQWSLQDCNDIGILRVLLEYYCNLYKISKDFLHAYVYSAQLQHTVLILSKKCQNFSRPAYHFILQRIGFIFRATILSAPNEKDKRPCLGSLYYQS